MPIKFPEFNPFNNAALFESFGVATGSSARALQAIAAETTDYARKSFEKSRGHFEKLMGVTKVEEAVLLQSEFAKSAGEDFMAEAAKIGELYSNFFKDAFNPVDIMSPARPAGGAPLSKASGKQG